MEGCHENDTERKYSTDVLKLNMPVIQIPRQGFKICQRLRKRHRHRRLKAAKLPIKIYNESIRLCLIEFSWIYWILLRRTLILRRKTMLKAISPSILSSDFSRLGDEIRALEAAGADWLHIDVMDGVFVPNISFGPPVISAVRSCTSLPFDVHLMIVNPERYIEEFIRAGADYLTIHYESCEDHAEILHKIRQLGAKASISIKPATPAFVLEPLLPFADMVLIMTVEPGFGGQTLIAETLESVEQVAAMRRAAGLSFLIEVDGGIHRKNAADAVARGADVLVAGSSVFRGGCYEQNIHALRMAAEGSI